MKYGKFKIRFSFNVHFLCPNKDCGHYETASFDDRYHLRRTVCPSCGESYGYRKVKLKEVVRRRVWAIALHKPKTWISGYWEEME